MRHFGFVGLATSVALGTRAVENTTDSRLHQILGESPQSFLEKRSGFEFVDFRGLAVPESFLEAPPDGGSPYGPEWEVLSGALSLEKRHPITFEGSGLFGKGYHAAAYRGQTAEGLELAVKYGVYDLVDVQY